MKHVLIIAHDYPPCPRVGALRPAGLAKYLPDVGWQATVLTVLLPGARPAWAPVIETGSKDVLSSWKNIFGLDGTRSLHDQLKLPVTRKQNSDLAHTRFFSLLRFFLTFPDSTKGWIPFAERALHELKDRVQVDAILTTSPPISAHMIGRKAKRILGCPWVADFRDLWSQNLAHSFLSLRWLELPLERRTLQSADALVTVSKPWAERLRRSYPNKPVFCITNGFDVDDFPTRPQTLTKNFTLTYTGRLYKGQRDPTPLFQAVHELIMENKMSRDALRIRFYGPVEPWLAPLVKSFGLEDVTEIAGLVNRHEALRQQQESQILLLLGWSDPRETGQHTGKVFEYLGSGRPILAVGGARGVVSELLEQSKAGVHCFSVEELKTTLGEWNLEYQKTGSVIYRGDQSSIEPYTHKLMASRFAEVLEQAIRQEARAGSLSRVLD
jgi:hypothetical protein